MRRKDGSPDPFASGTYVDAQGKATHLTAQDISLEPLNETWTSPITKATYLVRWRLRVPSMGIEIELKTPLKTQEIASTKQGRPLLGRRCDARRPPRFGAADGTRLPGNDRLRQARRYGALMLEGDRYSLEKDGLVGPVGFEPTTNGL